MPPMLGRLFVPHRRRFGPASQRITNPARSRPSVPRRPRWPASRPGTPPIGSKICGGPVARELRPAGAAIGRHFAANAIKSVDRSAARSRPAQRSCAQAVSSPIEAITASKPRAVGMGGGEIELVGARLQFAQGEAAAADAGGGEEGGTDRLHAVLDRDHARRLAAEARLALLEARDHGRAASGILRSIRLAPSRRPSPSDQHDVALEAERADAGDALRDVQHLEELRMPPGRRRSARMKRRPARAPLRQPAAAPCRCRCAGGACPS